MADSKTIRGPQDRAKVNLAEAYEVSYWCKELGCTEAELRAVVATVGSGVNAVRRHLSPQG